MERAELEQYRCLCKEIKHLENKIKQLSKEISIVKGSSSEFPYLKHRSRVEGPGKEEKALRKILYQRRARCLALKHQIYKFIDGIEDSRTRLVFELRYIDGWSWQKISMYMGSTSESYARKIHERFFKKRLD